MTMRPLFPLSSVMGALLPCCLVDIMIATAVIGIDRGSLSTLGDIMTHPSPMQQTAKQTFKSVVGSLKQKAISKPVAFAFAYAAFGSIAFKSAAMLGSGGTPAQLRLISAIVASTLCVLSNRIRAKPTGMSTARAAMAGFCVGPWFPIAATIYSSCEVYLGLKDFSAASQAEAEKLSPKALPVKLAKSPAKMS